MPKIYEFRDFSRPQDSSSLKAYFKALNDLATYRLSPGLNLEKMRTHSSYTLFSVRLNQKSRLLLTSVKNEDDIAWLILEYLPEHAYHQAHFLQPGTLKNAASLIEGAREILSISELPNQNEQRTEFQKEAASVQEEISETAKEQPIVIDLEYYNGMLIQMNEFQKGAMEAPLPLVVNGAAGSGKSCVGMLILRQCSEQLAQQDEKNETEGIIYVAQSEYLVKAMEKMWRDMPYASSNVRFLTYNMFLS